MTQPPTEKNKNAVSLEQLEQALESALHTDAALPRQVRNLLTISQRRAASPSETYHPPTLSTMAARYSALVGLAHTMSLQTLDKLYFELRGVPELETRLQLQARLLPYFDQPLQYTRAREIWSQLEGIQNAVVSISILIHLAGLAASDNNFEFQQMGALGGVIEVAQRISNAEARVRSLAALANHAPPKVAAKLYRQIFTLLARLPNESLKTTTIAALARYAPHQVESLIIDSARAIVRSVHRARALVALVQAFPERADLKKEALTAIARIDNEEDKVEILSQFAASLQRQEIEGIDYPEVLRGALQIAIEINKRLLRAKALVALAPLLTTDLQGEALATVNALANEGERAALLAELAPCLPPNVLVASLAVAHTMREQDARAHALTVLAHYVPAHARQQTVLDAFAAASNLSNHYERVTALLELVDVLPDALRGQAFTNALETTRLIENENARARALGMLGHHLPDSLRSRALEAALELGSVDQRISTLASLAPYLKGAEHDHAVRHMLDAAQQITLDYKRARALSTIAPHLTLAVLDEALRIVEGLGEPLDRFTAYLTLSHSLTPEQRPEVIAKAWALIPKIEEGYDRSVALVAIAPYLPASQNTQLKQMALKVVQSIEEDYDKASAISLLATLFADNPYGEAFTHMPDRSILLAQAVKAALSLPYQNARVELLTRCVPLWLQLNDALRYALWKEAVRRLKALPLPDVLLCLEALLPILESFGDTELSAKMLETLGFNALSPDKGQ